MATQSKSEKPPIWGLNQPCLLCQQETNNYICEHCLADLPRFNQPCQHCGYELITPDDASQATIECGQCQVQPNPFVRSCFCFPYNYPIAQMISRFKFQGDLIYGRALAQLMTTHIRSQYAPHSLPDALIPIPLHPWREASRGFNQAAYIARQLHKQLNIPVLALGRRTRRTQAQAQLSARQRNANMRKRFTTRPLPRWVKTVAVIDDVVTTGATSNSFAESLLQSAKEQGQHLEIHLWAVAFTPPDR